jgi:hypothetical protein
MGVNGKKNMTEQSEQTGSALFPVERSHPLRKTFDLIEQELRGQYSLGYTSDKNATKGLRGLKVSVDHDYKLQTRRGYYGDAGTECRA